MMKIIIQHDLTGFLSSRFCDTFANVTLLPTEQNKSRNLFQGRQIDTLYSLSPLARDQTYYDRLVHLQSAIYQLDSFLEQSWGHIAGRTGCPLGSYSHQPGIFPFESGGP
ncbi:MAG: hypothetical protein IPJ06_16125 [Saprospiraceae bacterium]|nr:hypothetical protein [Saprospiraceae bacterium]